MIFLIILNLVLTAVNVFLTYTLCLTFTKLISSKPIKTKPETEEKGLVDLPMTTLSDGTVKRVPDYNDQQLLT